MCDKGYSRQIDYENHLGSYDHNHKQRLGDMKKITAANETDRPAKASSDMRSISVEGATKASATGGRFQQAGAFHASAVGKGFKKVGVAVHTAPKAPAVTKHDAEKNSEQTSTEPVPAPKAAAVTNLDTEKDLKQTSTEPVPQPIVDTDAGPLKDLKTPEDVIVLDNADRKNEERDPVDWNCPILWEYLGASKDSSASDQCDFRKPTGCDHATCSGRVVTTTEVDDDGWLVLPH